MKDCNTAACPTQAAGTYVQVRQRGREAYFQLDTCSKAKRMNPTPSILLIKILC